MHKSGFFSSGRVEKIERCCEKEVWFPTALICNGHIAFGTKWALFSHSPVPGQLLLPSLLFIKSWQLSHNFTCSSVEKLSVDFIASLFFLFFPHGPTDLLRSLKAWSGSGESHLLISFNTLVSGCVCVWFRIPSLQNRRKPGDRGGKTDRAVIFTGTAALKCSFLRNHQGWFIWERISFTCGSLSPRQLAMEEVNALSCKGH